MSIHELLHTALRSALESAEKSNKTGLKTITFGSKALLSKFPEYGRFSDEPLFMLIEDLVRSKQWAIDNKPASIDLVEGLNSIKLKVDLAWFDEIAIYCDYVQLEDRADQIWIGYNEKQGLPYNNFRWKKWGNSIENAILNIERAVVMLTDSIYSRHQLSAILVFDAKKLEDKDIDLLLELHPELSKNLRTRRVILNYHCEAKPECCLIVENLDTYHYLRNYLPKNWMLVCGLGQRVTKKDVRSLDVVDLHASSETPLEIQTECREFWAHSNKAFLYWGDLDKNGDQIFQTLQKQIAQLEKWQPAYNAMHEFADKLSVRNVYQEAILITDLNLAVID